MLLEDLPCSLTMMLQSKSHGRSSPSNDSHAILVATSGLCLTRADEEEGGGGGDYLLL